METSVIVKVALSAVVAVSVFLCVANTVPSVKVVELQESKIEELRSICKFATTEIDYNNVASISKEGWFFGKKERKMWIEYKAAVKLGLDVEKIEISKMNDTITVGLPKPEILSINCVLDTFNENSYVTSKSIFFRFTAKDQNEAMAKANEEIRSSVENNSDLMKEAENRAKKIIENYLNQFKYKNGENYKILWTTNGEEKLGEVEV